MSQLRRVARRLTDATFRVRGRSMSSAGLVRRLRNPLPHTGVGLLRGAGATIGEGVNLKGRLHLDNATDLSKLRIGDHCYIGDGCAFDLANSIVIEDGAVLSAEVMVVTHQDDGGRSALGHLFPRRDGPVRIGAGSWLGVRATVLQGVTIGPGTFVAAGSVVVDSPPAGTLVAGVPAKVVRHLDAELSTG
jgi:acetyltransferase-like isoleucine patch superfamily enzyme